MSFRNYAPIIWYTFISCIPLLAFSVAGVLVMVLVHQIPQTPSSFGSVDTGAFFINYQSTRLTTFSTWTSTIAVSLSQIAIGALISLPIYKKISELHLLHDKSPTNQVGSSLERPGLLHEEIHRLATLPGEGGFDWLYSAASRLLTRSPPTLPRPNARSSINKLGYVWVGCFVLGYGIAGVDTWFQLSIQTVPLFTYTDANASSINLGRQSAFINCADVPVDQSHPNYLPNSSDPNTLCWTASDDTNAMGVDVVYNIGEDEEDKTTYALLVNKTLNPATGIAYKASTLAATSSCKNLKNGCQQSAESDVASVDCENGLNNMSWTWSSFKIETSASSVDNTLTPIWPVSNQESRYNFSGSSSASAPLGLALFTDENLSSQYNVNYEFWRHPPNLSQTLDPTFSGRLYSAIVGSFYGSLTLPQFTADQGFFYPLKNYSGTTLSLGNHNQYIGFAYQCSISFANVTYTYVDGSYSILSVSDVAPQTYGAWAFYAGDGDANSISPPPAGQISVEDGISEILWRNLSSSTDTYTSQNFSLALESAVRMTAAAWLKGAAAPAPPLTYQSRKSWPNATKVPKDSLITLVALNCIYSLLGLVASVFAWSTVYNRQGRTSRPAAPGVLEIAELFSTKGLTRLGTWTGDGNYESAEVRLHLYQEGSRKRYGFVRVSVNQGETSATGAAQTPVPEDTSSLHESGPQKLSSTHTENSSSSESNISGAPSMSRIQPLSENEGALEARETTSSDAQGATTQSSAQQAMDVESSGSRTSTGAQPRKRNTHPSMGQSQHI